MKYIYVANIAKNLSSLTPSIFLLLIVDIFVSNAQGPSVYTLSICYSPRSGKLIRNHLKYFFETQMLILVLRCQNL